MKLMIRNILMNTSLVEKKMEALSPELQQEVIDFIEFLTSKNETPNNKKNNEFNFNWAGGLSDYKDKHSSVELQHKSMDWR